MDTGRAPVLEEWAGAMVQRTPWMQLAHARRPKLDAPVRCHDLSPWRQPSVVVAVPVLSASRVVQTANRCKINGMKTGFGVGDISKHQTRELRTLSAAGNEVK